VNARRFASLAGTVAVTAIAAVGSYDHQRELALMAGQTPLLATLLPLSVDGMLLVATLALNDGRRSRWSAWLAFLVGVVASLAANVIVAAPDAISRVVSGWPAVALLLTVEVLARSGKAPVATGEVAEPVVAQPVEAPESAPVSPVEAPEVPAEHQTHPEEVKPSTVKQKRRPVAETRRLAEAMLSTGPNVTREEVAASLGITPRRLRSVLNAA
jgi:hypothetical protein